MPNPRLTRNQTAKTDARLIAGFCRPQKPSEWFPPSAEVKHLHVLVRRIEVLEEMLLMEQKRLAVSPRQTQSSIKGMIKIFERAHQTIAKTNQRPLR